MQGPSIHRVQLALPLLDHVVEEAARPTKISAVWSCPDEFQIDAVARHICDEAPKFLRVFFRRQSAAAAPGFVADSPEPDVKRVAIPGGGAHIRMSGLSGRGIAVFDPLIESLRGQAANVGGKVGIGANQLTEANELVSSEPIRFVFLWP